MFSTIKEILFGNMNDMCDAISKDEMEWIAKVDVAIKSGKQMKIYQNNDTGETQFSVVDPADPEYWLNSFNTQDDAIKWCESINLKYDST